MMRQGVVPTARFGMGSLVRLVIRLRLRVLLAIKDAIRVLFLRDRSLYYEPFYGTDNTAILAIKNILRPQRVLTRLLYGQIFRLPGFICRSRPTPKRTLAPGVKEAVEQLRSEGILILPSFFEKEARSLNERFSLNPDNYPNDGGYNRFAVSLKDKDVFSVFTNQFLIDVLAEYYGYQPYLRQLPGINCTSVKGDINKDGYKYNTHWHFDTPNLMTAHVLLSDTSEEVSGMLYARSSHKTLRTNLAQDDYWYSEELVRNRFAIEKCVGPIGTLVIFDPNGLHRLDARPNTFRSHLHINFVPGNSIIAEQTISPKGDRSIAEEDLRQLGIVQRQSLRYFIKFLQ